MSEPDIKTQIVSELNLLITDTDHSDEMLKLSAIGVGGVLYRHHRKDGDWKELLKSRETDIRHIHDWLASALSEKDEWLTRTDEKGRPRKLTKMHSIDQLLAEADKAFSKKMQTAKAKAPAVSGLPDDEKVEMELSEGYSLVKMLSPQALDRETAVMQHCVGLGGYDSHTSSKKYALFSLRDRFNKPHATLEVDVERRALLQIRGKQNAIPTAKYLALLGPYLGRLDSLTQDSALADFRITREGEFVHVSEIPDHAVFAGSLDLSGYDIVDPKIPDDLAVEGNLTVGREFADVFAKKCTVRGHVIARGLKFPGFCEQFVFGGHLSLEGSTVTKLPERLHIRGDLILKDTTGAILPVGTVVDGNLDISSSDISSLPAGLVVGGSLRAIGSSLTALPDDLKIGGGLLLGGSEQLHELPNYMEVGGNVQLRGTKVSHIPVGMRIGGTLSIDADVAEFFSVDDSAEIGDGLYFRPVRNKLDYLGKLDMTLDEFRASLRNRQPCPAAAPA